MCASCKQQFRGMVNTLSDYKCSRKFVSFSFSVEDSLYTQEGKKTIVKNNSTKTIKKKLVVNEEKNIIVKFEMSGFISSTELKVYIKEFASQEKVMIINNPYYTLEINETDEETNKSKKMMTMEDLFQRINNRVNMRK